MRSVLLGLVLLNALFWAWATWIDTPAIPSGSPHTAINVPTLMLVSESDDFVAEIETKRQLNPEDAEPQILTDSGATNVADVDDIPLDSADPIEDNRVTATASLRDTNPPADLPVASADAEPGRDVVPDQTASQPDNASESPSLINPLIKSDPITHPQRCISVGPFLNLRQASIAASKLTASGLSTSQRVEEAEVWVGHWVHLSAFPTRAEAIAVVERLRTDGVKDIYIEPSGDLQNSVSLGLFSDIERAEIRAGQVRKLGVRPQIQDRHREGLVYWVDTQLDAGFDVDIDTFAPLPEQQLRRITIPCDSVSDNAG